MICGIDEAGRGPLAGPLCVAGVVLHTAIDGLDDSKKLSEAKREALYEQIVQNAAYKIVFTDNQAIDKIGLSQALRQSIETIKAALNATRYIMDGNTTFGVSGLECLIKGDTKVEAIKAASILAKVSRDRYMKEIAKDFPSFSFASHKGYGTKQHIAEIVAHGYSEIHRKSFTIKKLF